ncbi:membrane protein DedA, SNARE-associated domain [Nocardioides exalbidus]|uniref:Membrane protein DedA, SNARE-associated domain n=1 Tax=Nocardioides exalbidus TaxID=402596 RepID=A0A1H4YRM1_9ACTN|nr:DedA family protein [Nocardioides exalbidus]SED20315.1 membrane protein DedA, SNARE-associated domain [Nocardioides exalbidus]
MEAVLDWLVLVMRTIGSPGVGLATALETVFPPIPSELVLPLSGYTASQGHYSVVAAIAWATAGSLIGALVLYWLGAAWGLERLCRLADRIPLMHADDVRRAVEWFRRHGRAAVFFGRLVPGVRSLVSIPAGVDRMPLATFCAYTTAGSLAWNAALVLAGYELGEQWHLVEAYVGPASNVVYVLVAVVVVVVAARRLRHRLSGEPPRSTPPQ